MKGMRQKIALFLAALVLGGATLLLPVPSVRYGAAFLLLWVLPGLAWMALVPLGVLDRVERWAVGLGLCFVVSPMITLLVTYLPGPVSRITLLAAIAVSIGLPLGASALVPALRKQLSGSVGMPSMMKMPPPPVPLPRGEGEIVPPPWRGRLGGGGQRLFSEQQSVGAESHKRFDVGAIFSARCPLWRDGRAWLLAAVLIAAALRVVNVGYSEFQGDEAAVMVRAAQALEGDEATVFQHRKGPAELAVVMATWRLTGTASEWMARLPFAWAGVLGVAAVFLLGRRLGRPHAGGIAACLLAVEGFFVGFGRIVQYQSLVFALGALGLLCLLAYWQRGRGVLLAVAAALFAGGALAHYDAALALPAGLLLVAARLWRDRRNGWRTWLPVTTAVLVGGALLGLFYVPLLRGPYAEGTSYYVSGRVGSGPYNHLPSTFELSAVYDSIYLLALLVLALIGMGLVTWRRWGRGVLALAAVPVALAITGLVWPEMWAVGERTWAWAPFAALLVGALLAPRQTMGQRALWLWLGLPALFYLFFVALPLTHVHTAFPAWAMLAGLGLADLGRWLAARSRPVLRVAVVGGVLVYALCGFYAIMVFVDHTPEYRRTFPEFKNPLYWTPYERMPEAGLFGFPYRAGWKTVGRLMDAGVLAGSYASNEEREITDYYTRQRVRLDCASPDMFVIAADVQDEVPIPWDQIEDEYRPAAMITVGGRPKITVYSRGATGEAAVYRAEEYGQLFDLGSTPDRVAWPAFDRMEALQPEEYVPHAATLGNVARLLGYTVDTGHAVPGGYVELTLIWQALEPTLVDYHSFTHLYDGEAMRGQLDGQPVCGGFPTSRWQPGQIVVDPYRIPIWEDAPPGRVPLLVGLYDFATMERLPVFASDGGPIGDSVHLTDVEIGRP
jgi:4-amino-4-deoxy-L-arabinose transferase-like glycosyltransferase